MGTVKDEKLADFRSANYSALSLEILILLPLIAGVDILLS